LQTDLLSPGFADVAERSACKFGSSVTELRQVFCCAPHPGACTLTCVGMCTTVAVFGFWLDLCGRWADTGAYVYGIEDITLGLQHGTLSIYSCRNNKVGAQLLKLLIHMLLDLAAEWERNTDWTDRDGKVYHSRDCWKYVTGLISSGSTASVRLCSHERGCTLVF